MYRYLHFQLDTLFLSQRLLLHITALLLHIKTFHLKSPASSSQSVAPQLQIRASGPNLRRSYCALLANPSCRPRPACHSRCVHSGQKHHGFSFPGRDFLIKIVTTLPPGLRCRRSSSSSSSSSNIINIITNLPSWSTCHSQATTWVLLLRYGVCFSFSAFY